MNCLGCHKLLPDQFLDLGDMPLANDLLDADKLGTEKKYSLMLAFCTYCYLVQLKYLVPPDKLYNNYIYYSSNSTTFLEHMKTFVKTLERDYNLNINSRVLEIASNDGYLLQYLKPYGATILGVEPATNLAAAANLKGLPTLNTFFNRGLVETFTDKFDIIIGNNVLAHVPDINNFIAAVRMCLAPNGMATFEFPYLLRLMDNLEFDTVYHEHVFYYSVLALNKLFQKNGLELFDIKYSSIHGGSIRIYTQHIGRNRSINSIVSYYELNELSRGLDQPMIYEEFANRVSDTEHELLKLCQRLKSQGKTIAAYGAPAKGNILLNYCGLDRTIIDFTVDISPSKQGKFLPGSHIPILPPSELLLRKPDFTLLLSWNFANEIKDQQEIYMKQGGKFIIPIPQPYIIRD